MAARDLDHDFGEMMIGQAAADPDLVDHYREKIFEPEVAGEYPTETGFIRGLVRWQYPMSEQQMNRAVGQCVASLIDGVELGRDFFKDVR